MKMIAALLCITMLYACKAKPNYYLRIADTINDKYGYINSQGDTIIPLGKYPVCYTDTFINYAVVLQPGRGWIGINKAQKILFDIFPFDNGPDYPSDGLFRIIKNNRIGFANLNGDIVIKPQFGCAFPFNKGIAKVSVNCKTVAHDKYNEHHRWTSNTWFYINKLGKVVRAE
jgi:hypothetical protein